MADHRGSLKPDPDLCRQVAQHAAYYRHGVQEFTNILLEWLLADPERIDQAVDENRKRGTRKALANRVVVPIEQARGTKTNGE